jgi:hypothetical protein
MALDAYLGRLINALEPEGEFALSNGPEGCAKVEREMRQTFDRINQALSNHGLPTHREPERLAELPESMRDKVLCERLGFYSSTKFECLRELAAHLWILGSVPKSPGDIDNEAVARYAEERNDGAGAPGLAFDHLVFAFGSCYLPADFAPVLSIEPVEMCGACQIGSAPQLLAECELLANVLGAPDEKDPSYWSLEVDGSPRLPHWDHRRADSKAFNEEWDLCFRLMKVARMSIDSRSAIFFG